MQRVGRDEFVACEGGGGGEVEAAIQPRNQIKSEESGREIEREKEGRKALMSSSSPSVETDLRAWRDIFEEEKTGLVVQEGGLLWSERGEEGRGGHS